MYIINISLEDFGSRLSLKKVLVIVTDLDLVVVVTRGCGGRTMR